MSRPSTYEIESTFTNSLNNVYYSEVIEPEMIKTTPLDMSTYKYLFNATRIPVKDVDTAKKYDPETNNHIVVVRNGNLYEVQVVYPNGEFLSEKDLER